MTRSGRPRICIAHQTVWAGDAIGNDIVGAYELLTRCGYEVAIVCHVAHPDVKASCRVLDGIDAPAFADQFDLLLYHHSFHWTEGEEMVRSFRGPVVVKYHNITPSEYFEPYTPFYFEKCREGRIQTGRLAAMSQIVHWQADSSYNAQELAGLGIEAGRLSVVPPFNRVDRLARETVAAVYPAHGPFVALFVGRRVPNKGHAHLIHTMAAWRDLFPEMELRCRVVGSTDAHLASYYEELRDLEISLGVQGSIDWLEHITNADLDAAFRTSHVYLNLSEHEGFCVPLIEAQALGLPVVSTNATALGETMGQDQLAVPVPKERGDYDFIAGLVHEVCIAPSVRESVVRAGFANVYRRFVSQGINARFLESMAPALEALEGIEALEA
jgi:glycosyltransferase involved in cell wall biosynthesis